MLHHVRSGERQNWVCMAHQTTSFAFGLASALDLANISIETIRLGYIGNSCLRYPGCSSPFSPSYLLYNSPSTAVIATNGNATRSSPLAGTCQTDFGIHQAKVTWLRWLHRHRSGELALNLGSFFDLAVNLYTS